MGLPLSVKQINSIETLPKKVPCSLYSLTPMCTSPWVKDLQLKASRVRSKFFNQQKDLRSAYNQERYLTYKSAPSPVYLATLDTDPILEDKEDYLHRSYLSAISSNMSRKAAFVRDGSLTDIPNNKLESIPAEIVNENHNANDYTKVHVEGPPHLPNKLRELIHEFSAIL